jgi:hypothetical protein
MSQNDILTLIDADIAHLKQARALLAGADKRGPGRPKSTAAKPKQKGKISPEGRARIAAAQKARWAKQKKAAKKKAA